MLAVTETPPMPDVRFIVCARGATFRTHKAQMRMRSRQPTVKRRPPHIADHTRSGYPRRFSFDSEPTVRQGEGVRAVQLGDTSATDR